VLGTVNDTSMKIKDATVKDVYPIKFSDYGSHGVSSGSRQHRLRQANRRPSSGAASRRLPGGSHPPIYPRERPSRSSEANPNVGTIATKLTQASS